MDVRELVVLSDVQELPVLRELPVIWELPVLWALPVLSEVQELPVLSDLLKLPVLLDLRELPALREMSALRVLVVLTDASGSCWSSGSCRPAQAGGKRGRLPLRVRGHERF